MALLSWSSGADAFFGINAPGALAAACFCTEVGSSVFLASDFSLSLFSFLSSPGIDRNKVKKLQQCVQEENAKFGNYKN